MVNKCPHCGNGTYVKDDSQITSGRRKPKVVISCTKCSWSGRVAC